MDSPADTVVTKNCPKTITLKNVLQSLANLKQYDDNPTSQRQHPAYSTMIL
jgi:hypothetical protein